MANIELLNRLRTRFLRMRHRKHFDMDKWVAENECGTSMCIAGHALDLQGYKTRRHPDSKVLCFVSPKSGRFVSPAIAAQRELGLTDRIVSGTEANNFNGLFYDERIKTPKQAAKRIEKLIAELTNA